MRYGLPEWSRLILSGIAVSATRSVAMKRRAAEVTGIPGLAEIDEEIREVRANLRDLIEQETARSGAQDDNQDDALIAAQEEKLARLLAGADIDGDHREYGASAAAPADERQPTDALVAERSASDAQGPHRGRQRNLQQGSHDR